MQKIESDKFRKWLNKLKDQSTKARIVARVNRLMEGLPGDVSPVGKGVSELRIHTGSGYRVYYYQQGNVCIILLCGGDKSTQSKDIENAHAILEEWRTDND